MPLYYIFKLCKENEIELNEFTLPYENIDSHTAIMFQTETHNRSILYVTFSIPSFWSNDRSVKYNGIVNRNTSQIEQEIDALKHARKTNALFGEKRVERLYYGLENLPTCALSSCDYEISPLYNKLNLNKDISLCQLHLLEHYALELHRTKKHKEFENQNPKDTRWGTYEPDYSKWLEKEKLFVEKSIEKEQLVRQFYPEPFWIKISEI